MQGGSLCSSLACTAPLLPTHPTRPPARLPHTLLPSPLPPWLQVSVDVPDQKGRLAILNVHSRNKRLGEDIDLKEIALRTPGFSGADLANLLNEVRAEASQLAGARCPALCCTALRYAALLLSSARGVGCSGAAVQRAGPGWWAYACGSAACKLSTVSLAGGHLPPRCQTAIPLPTTPHAHAQRRPCLPPPW